MSAIPKKDKSFVNDRVKNTPTFKDRLIALAGKPDQLAVGALIANVPAWAAFVKDHRNVVAHASRDRLDAHRAEMVHDARELTVALLTLALVLMHHLGLGADVQRAATRLPRILHSARRMHAAQGG